MTDAEARVRQVVDGLKYDFSEFTVSHFLAHLETIRQREIILNSAPFSQGLHAFWLRADTADYVFFDQHTHEIHQVHHILHEIGHIILGHQPRDLASVLPPVIVEQLRSATSVSLHGHCRMWNLDKHPEELQAELFVRHLQQRILIAGRLRALTHPTSSIDALTRFTRSLGYSD